MSSKQPSKVYEKRVKKREKKRKKKPKNKYILNAKRIERQGLKFIGGRRLYFAICKFIYMFVLFVYYMSLNGASVSLNFIHLFGDGIGIRLLHLISVLLNFFYFLFCCYCLPLSIAFFFVLFRFLNVPHNTWFFSVLFLFYFIFTLQPIEKSMANEFEIADCRCRYDIWRHFPMVEMLRETFIIQYIVWRQLYDFSSNKKEKKKKKKKTKIKKKVNDDDVWRRWWWLLEPLKNVK